MATLIAISPANVPITYYANDSYTLSFQVTDEDGDPVSLGGKTLTLTLRKHLSGTVIETLSTASEISINGSIITVTLNLDLEERAYIYDLYNNTDDETIMYGLFIVTKEVHA